MTSKRMLIAAPIRGLSFVEQDVNILSKHFDVQCITYTPTHLPKMITSILAGSFDLVYIWFANHYAPPIATACKVARIPCVFVPGGVDFANEPEIWYGHMRFRPARAVMKLTLELPALVLPVSEFMKQRVLRIGTPRTLRVIYNGVDTERFSPKGAKQDIVLSVAKISERTIWYKRLDIFVRAAKFVPNYRFILAGEHADGAIQRLN
jgi:glycosyltransferase involved in cell wall biosynthesis